MCHLANVSYRLGSQQPFSKQSKAFGDAKEAYETLAHMEDHLKENKLPLDSLSYRLGRKLTVDPKTETFLDDAEANGLLTREYRGGFEVPKKI